MTDEEFADLLHVVDQEDPELSPYLIIGWNDGFGHTTKLRSAGNESIGWNELARIGKAEAGRYNPILLVKVIGIVGDDHRVIDGPGPPPDLTPREKDIMRAIIANPGLGMQEAIDNGLVPNTRTFVTYRNLANDLVKAECLTRQRLDDRSPWKYTATERGRAAYGRSSAR